MNNETGEKITNFTDLNAWKEAHAFALLVYTITEQFPQKEIFSLTNQLRRAVVSIGSNIAEGFSRNSMKEKIHFYGIAQGSNTETQSQLILSRDLKYLPEKEFDAAFNQSVVVHKLLNGLIKSSRNKLD